MIENRMPTTINQQLHDPSEKGTQIMKTPRIFSALIVTCLMILASAVAHAQSGGADEPRKHGQGQAAESAAEWQEAEGQETLWALRDRISLLERQRKAIVGSWLVDVTTLGLPPNCGCADTKNLGTFTEEGSFIGAAPADSRQSFATPGHGSWAHQGGRTFALTFLALIYRPDGVIVGLLKLRGTATLDETGDKFSGPAKGVITDLAGRVLFQYESTVQGTRIKVEPLN